MIRAAALLLRRHLPLLSFRPLPSLSPLPRRRVSYNLERLAQLHNSLGEMQCSGCGSLLQVEQPEEEGFIEQFKLLRILEENEQALSLEEQDLDTQREAFAQLAPSQPEDFQGKSRPLPISTFEEYEQVTQEQEFFRQVGSQHRRRVKRAICERCVSIKRNSPAIQPQAQDVQEVASADFIERVVDQMQRRCLVLYVVDVMNLSQSLERRVLQALQKKQMKVILVINKSDCLPSQANESRLRAQLNSMGRLSPESPPAFEQLFITSAKTGHNMPALLKHLAKEKKEAVSQGKPRLYVLGSTNSGKSSLLNKMNNIGNKYKEGASSEQVQTDPLTESHLPGTTMQLTRVQNNLGFRLYDSPGFPVDNAGESVQNIKLQQLLLVGKKTAPKSFSLGTGHSLLIGGLAVFEHMSGPVVELQVSTSPHVNIRVLKTSQANLFYFQHYDQLVSPVFHPDPSQVLFNKAPLSLAFDQNGHCTQELELSNIGVINFSYKGKHKTSAEVGLFHKDSQQWSLRAPVFPQGKGAEGRTRQFVSKTRLVRRMQEK